MRPAGHRRLFQNIQSGGYRATRTSSVCKLGPCDSHAPREKDLFTPHQEETGSPWPCSPGSTRVKYPTPKGLPLPITPPLPRSPSFTVTASRKPSRITHSGCCLWPFSRFPLPAFPPPPARLKSRPLLQAPGSLSFMTINHKSK